MNPIKTAAVVTIKHAARMTEQGRKDIAAWLRQEAKDLLKEGRAYAPTFRASYYCPPEAGGCAIYSEE